MSKKLKLEAGTYWPDEYDWETQFAEALNGAYSWVTVDAGKLRGVALAYKELLESKKREWVGLTDEDLSRFDDAGIFYAKATEDLLRKKNT